MSVTVDSLRSPASEYTGPPRDWYFGDEWFQRDLEAVFKPRWLVAGHVDELDAQGSYGYLTYELGDEKIFIRRDEDGRLRAYHNFCPHRGATLCEGRTGAAPTKRVVCPYHLWTYELTEGAAISTNYMHDDFDQSQVRLSPVHVDEWYGFIFVCLAESPRETLAEHMAAASFGGWDFGGMKLAAYKSHMIGSNWKIVVENNLECYHCASNHPELCEVYDWKEITTQRSDFDSYVERRGNGLEVWNVQARSPYSLNGERVCALPTPRVNPGEDYDEEQAAIVAFEPGAALHVARDAAWLFLPRAIGPEQTELRQYWLVNREAEEGRDYDVETVMAFWDGTMQQDLRICEWVQTGMKDPAYKPGVLNRVHQMGQAGFFSWYTTQIAERFPEIVPDPAALVPGRS